jgi:hypothetical protein
VMVVLAPPFSNVVHKEPGSTGERSGRSQHNTKPEFVL